MSAKKNRAYKLSLPTRLVNVRRRSERENSLPHGVGALVVRQEYSAGQVKDKHPQPQMVSTELSLTRVGSASTVMIGMIDNGRTYRQLGDQSAQCEVCA